jgi:hypothetical protein
MQGASQFDSASTVILKSGHRSADADAKPPPIGREDAVRRLHHAGQHAPAGAYRCALCGYDLKLDDPRELPPCPTCGSDAYEELAERPDED